MRTETAREAAEQASKLLTEGELHESGVLRVVGSSTLCAFVANMVFLTEPTRLVVRKRKDRLDYTLKWRLTSLLDHLSVEWWREGEDEARDMLDVTNAFNRAGLLGPGRRTLTGGKGVARELASHLRETPTPLLSKLHDLLGESLRQSEMPPELLLPVPESRGGVSADLVRRCLLLPYDDRKVLVKDWHEATNNGGEKIQALLREVRALRPTQARELQQMLW
jgi:hypothetical protein